eukprot:GGOE01049530.1.p1 GENE.GGOE01049530.1~~GGOE01049530.1.p1  ORF type:complete len:251 (+),score=64.90 GGOE01049530.1:60-812(+)
MATATEGDATPGEGGAAVQCVNCERTFNANRNPKWACTYHPGCYGLAGPIKRGLGWNCCGRERHEPGCKTGPHQAEYTLPARSLRESLDEYMALAFRHRKTRSRSLPDVQRYAHHQVVVQLDVDIAAFTPSSFVAALARAIPIDQSLITVLTVQPGTTVTFMLEGLREEKSVVERTVDLLRANGLKNFPVKKVILQAPQSVKGPMPSRRSSTPPAKKAAGSGAPKAKAAARAPPPPAGPAATVAKRGAKV